MAALALVSGCAAEDIADAPGEFDEVSHDEAAEALRRVVGTKLACLYGGQTPATLEVYYNPNGPPACALVNRRTGGATMMYCLGEPPFRICPNCFDLSRSFDCRY